MNNHVGLTNPLDGMYKTTWEWASAYYSDPQKLHQGYYTFDRQETCTLSEPKRLERELDPIFPFFLTWERLPQFVAIIPGGRVYGFEGAVISPDNKLIWDVSVEFHLSPQNHSVLARTHLPPAASLPETIGVLTASGSHNYYHWLFDGIARLELLRSSGIHIDKYIISPQGDNPFQYETLAALGIPKEKVIECHSDTHIESCRLVVPSLLGYMGNPPKWAGDFLRNELVKMRGVQSVSGYERIYISRADARYRNVVNENEVMGLLAGFGFKSIQLEYLTVYEQARIFSSAHIVVSPHGAGLANLVFCNPESKVVEIFSPQYVNPMYWVISSQAGLDYYYLIGEGHRLFDPTLQNGVGEDIFVNIERLRNLMEIVIGSR